LDEPTSGLDAYTAEIIVDCLKDLAKGGRTIIFTIHQPNSQIFTKFDQLILLAKGELVYWGPAKQSTSYFKEIGHPIPEYSNPADFFSNY
jgi:ABC-type multidrug transport system ATPase subunit